MNSAKYQRPIAAAQIASTRPATVFGRFKWPTPTRSRSGRYQITATMVDRSTAVSA
jgi:hypothetical protein